MRPTLVSGRRDSINDLRFQRLGTFMISKTWGLCVK
jgi:hypothetical protein